jgi:hypothetical protein
MQDPSALIDAKTVVSVGIPALIAVLSWFLVNWLSARREQANRRREARVKALEQAYLRLANSSNRPITDNVIADLETFVAELQLYGSPHHLSLMQQIVDQFVHPPATKRVDFDPLLVALRDSLREELRLEKVHGTVWWLRITHGSPREIAPQSEGPSEPSPGAKLTPNPQMEPTRR